MNNSGNKSKQLCRRLFIESSEKIRVNVADGLLIDGAKDRPHTAKELKKKFNIIWTNEIYVEEQLAQEAGLPSTLTQTFKEFLANQGLQEVPHDALGLYDMGDTGYALFFKGTKEYKKINAGDLILFGGVLTPYHVQRISKEEISEQAITIDPFSLATSRSDRIMDAKIIRGFGCFAQSLPDNVYWYNKVASANLRRKEIKFGNISFFMLEACRDIEPIFKDGVNCGHILCFEYAPKNYYFEALGIEMQHFDNTGKKIDFPSAYHFNATSIHELKYQLSKLPELNEEIKQRVELFAKGRLISSQIQLLITLAGNLSTNAKELLYSFTRLEQQKLLAYKEFFSEIFNSFVQGGYRRNYIKSNPTTDINKLKAFMESPNNALSYLINEFEVVEETFNFEYWHIPIVRNHFNNFFGDNHDYRLPTEKEAYSLLEEGKKILANDILQKEQLTKAVSLLQQALQCFRISWETKNFNFEPFEDTMLSITPEIANCYWYLFKAYEQLELLSEAWFFIKRCLFLAQKEIKLDVPFDLINEAYESVRQKRAFEDLDHDFEKSSLESSMNFTQESPHKKEKREIEVSTNGQIFCEEKEDEHHQLYIGEADTENFNDGDSRDEVSKDEDGEKELFNTDIQSQAQIVTKIGLHAASTPKQPAKNNVTSSNNFNPQRCLIQ